MVIIMSNLFPSNWWWKASDAFGSSILPSRYSAPQDSCANDGWEDFLDGDLELFLEIEELLTGTRKSYWEHKRLFWDWHVEKVLHEDLFHIRYHMPLDDLEALVEHLGDAYRRCEEPIYPKMVASIIGIRQSSSCWWQLLQLHHEYIWDQ
jgi:hypothetical protein